jgi:conjugal transfer/entry exclusion protein
MDQVLLYISLFCSIFALFFCLYASARVGNFIKSTQGLEWNDIANITGDLATLKKTIQTLNNRINGMHSPKLQEQELLLQILKNAPNQTVNGEIKNVGG